MKSNNKIVSIAVIAVLLLTAYIPAMLWWTAELPTPIIFKYLRSIIHMSLFAVWGVSIRHRIIQPQVRRYLLCIAALIVFWIFVKQLKYYYVTDMNLIRALWYSFYIPMLLIPTLGVQVALSLGKPEDYRLTKWAGALLVPTVFLLLLVLTNDLHQLVFQFPPDQVWTDVNGTYNTTYWIVAVWILLNALAAIGTIAFKCRIPHSHTVLCLPLIPLVLCILYAVLYIIGWPPLRLFARDMTAVYCILFAAVFESCMASGLIQNNTRYTALFRISSIAAQIADKDCEVILTSDAALPVSKDVLCEAKSAPVMLKGGIRITGAPIRDGHIFWLEDVSELLAILEQLDNAQEELRGYARLLEEENKQKQQQRELEEQKRLYAAVHQTIAPTMRQLAVLLEKLNAAQDVHVAKTLHGRIGVTGVYLKRRSNLVFLADENGTVPAEELLLCLNESVSNLQLTGTACAVQFDLDGGIDGKAAGLLYDFFETVVEAAWNELHGLNVIVTRRDENLSIVLMLPCKAELAAPADRFPGAKIEQDEEVCYYSLTVPEGGVLL